MRTDSTMKMIRLGLTLRVASFYSLKALGKICLKVVEHYKTVTNIEKLKTHAKMKVLLNLNY